MHFDPSAAISTGNVAIGQRTTVYVSYVMAYVS